MSHAAASPDDSHPAPAAAAPAEPAFRSAGEVLALLLGAALTAATLWALLAPHPALAPPAEPAAAAPTAEAPASEAPPVPR